MRAAACGARAASCSCAPFTVRPRWPLRPARPGSPLGVSTPSAAGGGEADLKFTHLTTNDGLSQGYVVDILQDRRGFMWFATRDGLNRYDGYTFVVYKHDPNDPGSLSSNFLQDLMEDDEGYLWVATSTGVNRFDPRTERCTRYLHDPDNRDTLGGASVKSVVQDGHGYLWFGTEDSGLDKLDPRRGTFTHYRDDSDGRFVGRITQVIEDGHGDIWFTGERGLFHVDQQNGRVTRRPPASNALSAESVYEDAAGDLWLLANSPVAGLVRYDRRAERLTSYPLDPACERRPRFDHERRLAQRDSCCRRGRWTMGAVERGPLLLRPARPPLHAQVPARRGQPAQPRQQRHLRRVSGPRRRAVGGNRECGAQRPRFPAATVPPLHAPAFRSRQLSRPAG